jgi:hypothetical protein
LAFGGGKIIENFSFLSSPFILGKSSGLKYPDFSHSL